ncbi:hypothetical protein rosag_42450 [Roseisolibacter agri]|uniref:Uncharacterized protein n=1 Tax=Roseisolibacter agri TaxID=2014610 RepID=A0AA37V4C2_9BACT|nr:hypothetical protein rosag_42450 [Roseisolibacter agri]
MPPTRTASVRTIAAATGPLGIRMGGRVGERQTSRLHARHGRARQLRATGAGQVRLATYPAGSRIGPRLDTPDDQIAVARGALSY